MDVLFVWAMGILAPILLGAFSGEGGLFAAINNWLTGFAG